MSHCYIIIPAYNSATSLVHTLPALFNQTIPPNWQVQIILSDDGSTDHTRDLVLNHPAPAPWLPTQFITGPHAGAATARNRALAQVDQGLILFLGADIILRPGVLRKHLAFHQTHTAPNFAALGLVLWDPRLKPTPLMEWMTHGGPQNDFDSLLGQAQAPPQHFFYASHLSLKRQLLGQKRFPTTYQSYGWEDIDLGRQLAGSLNLYVLHQAIGLHRHYYTAKHINQRQFSVGMGVDIYQQRYPKTQLVPPKPLIHATLLRFAKHLGLISLLWIAMAHLSQKNSFPKLFSLATSLEFWRGVYTGRVYPQSGNSYPHNFPQ